MIIKFCTQWTTVCGLKDSDAGGIRTQVCAALQMPGMYDFWEHGTCKVFICVRESLLARKIKHLANIDT